MSNQELSCRASPWKLLRLTLFIAPYLPLICIFCVSCLRRQRFRIPSWYYARTVTGTLWKHKSISTKNHCNSSNISLHHLVPSYNLSTLTTLMVCSCQCCFTGLPYCIIHPMMINCQRSCPHPLMAPQYPTHIQPYLFLFLTTVLSIISDGTT